MLNRSSTSSSTIQNHKSYSPYYPAVPALRQQPNRMPQIYRTVLRKYSGQNFSYSCQKLHCSIQKTARFTLLGDHDPSEHWVVKLDLVIYVILYSTIATAYNVSRNQAMQVEDRCICWEGSLGSLPICSISCKRCVLPQASISVSWNSLHPSSHKPVSEHFILTHLLFTFSPQNFRHTQWRNWLQRNWIITTIRHSSSRFIMKSTSIC